MNRITACLFPLLLIFTFSSLSAQTPKIKNFLPAEVRMENGIATLSVDGRPVSRSTSRSAIPIGRTRKALKSLKPWPIAY